MDNRIQIEVTNSSFPSAKVTMEAGEKCYIESGAMIYRTPGLELKTRLNAEGNNVFGKLLSAVGRSIVSNENIFVTEVVANQSGSILLAPKAPGKIQVLEVGATQYRLNDGAFLALDGSCRYKMERQNLGKAIFSRTGGLFVMTTEGEGRMLINAFGDIQRIDLHNESITIDNGHVLAWDKNLDYNLHFENTFFQSMGTGEGLVNTFTGTGSIYIQTLNAENFAAELAPFIAAKLPSR